IEFGKLHYPVFHSPELETREGYLRKLLCEGLLKRYGLRVRMKDKEFIVESIDDPRRLPTYVSEEIAESAISDPSGSPIAHSLNRDSLITCPAVARAVEEVMDRLQLELAVIEKTGFISYFLIVGDFVRFGRSRGISCVARGSAAGSIVTYLLEISNVDPIRYHLL